MCEITSVGRFVTGKFAIKQDGKEQTFASLPGEAKDKISDSVLLVYHCEGTEAEIKEWMSGNICRCGAYPGICAAIAEARENMRGPK